MFIENLLLNNRPKIMRLNVYCITKLFPNCKKCIGNTNVVDCIFIVLYYTH